MQKRKRSKSDKRRRLDWEVNHELISQAFFDLVAKEKKFPSHVSIAKATGLSIETIKRHLNDEEAFEEMNKKLRAIKDRALMTLAAKAMKGESVQWMRLFFDVVDGLDKGGSTSIEVKGVKVKITRE